MNKEEFSLLFRILKQLSFLSDRELAKHFQVQVPTIDRWSSGTTAPPDDFRLTLITSLAKYIEDDIS